MDAMVDIETLSTANNAVVLSIGAVKFTFKELIPSQEFYAELGQREQITKGRHIDPETIKWWGHQAIDPPEGDADPKGVLMFLANFTKDCENVWFRGPHFDHVILQSLADDFKTPLGWKYYQVRDCRTLDLFHRRERSKSEVKHHALSDAKEQAKDVIYVMERIK